MMKTPPSSPALAARAWPRRPALAPARPPVPPREKWSFAGPFGTFDRGQIQRGFQVYREVCASCHGLNRIAFRNLIQPGGPEFSEGQIRQLASEYQIKDGPNEAGDMFERPGRLADRLPSPFPNDNAAAAANGGKAPPDLSVMAKARTYERGFPWFIIDVLPVPGAIYQEQGVDYIKALLTGYVEPPEGTTVPPGGHYNKYYPGHIIAMPNVLSDGQVAYPKNAEGQPVVPETATQYAARRLGLPGLDRRAPHGDPQALGLQVILFLIVLSGLLYYMKKRIWARVGGEVQGLQPELHKTS
jgi:cytochrome c1